MASMPISLTLLTVTVLAILALYHSLADSGRVIFEEIHGLELPRRFPKVFEMI